MVDIEDSLRKADINETFVTSRPTTKLEVEYDSGKRVELGNYISTHEAKDTPRFKFDAPDKDTHYTLLMVDPDAPSKDDPKWSPFRHWVMANIPGSGDSQAGKVLAPYIGPGPPADSGDHRYLFLLYKQPKKDIPFAAVEAKSYQWNLHEFIDEYKLGFIGVNFFISHHEEQHLQE